jgi:hypothetical protein
VLALGLHERQSDNHGAVLYSAFGCVMGVYIDKVDRSTMIEMALSSEDHGVFVYSTDSKMVVSEIDKMMNDLPADAFAHLLERRRTRAGPIDPADPDPDWTHLTRE